MVKITKNYKILQNFINVYTKPTSCILFKFNTSFFSSCSLIRLVNIIWFAPVLICFVIFTCLYFWSLLVSPASNTPQIQQWNAGKRCGIFSKLTVKIPTFFNVPMSVRLLWCLFSLTLNSLHTLLLSFYC